MSSRSPNLIYGARASFWMALAGVVIVCALVKAAAMFGGAA